MHITKESRHRHTISAYDNAQIEVNHIAYTQSLIIHAETIITPWHVSTLYDLNEQTLAPVLSTHPSIIIIGHANLRDRLPNIVLQILSARQIGIECMSIGAASRTFNVLLSEQRKVTAGFILNTTF